MKGVENFKRPQTSSLSRVSLSASALIVTFISFSLNVNPPIHYLRHPRLRYQSALTAEVVLDSHLGFY